MVYRLDETHDSALRSWVESADRHPDFPVQNLPLGIFSEPERDRGPHPGVAIGAKILDLAGAAQAGLLDDLPAPLFAASTLNRLFALDLSHRAGFRRRLSALLSDPAHAPAVEPFLRDAKQCVMHLPAAIGDYTDFYVGIHHATNVGRLFRPDNPLLPNYKHVPIGYHGRASTVRPSGTPVRRPSGQIKPPGSDTPTFGPTGRLDYEVELGVWIGRGNALGEPIPIAEAPEHVAGYCLLNDWSARDFQAWEYQPLGPFLAKNFLTSVSPWVVTAEALAPFRLPQPQRPRGDPRPLDYLWDEADQQGGALALELEASLLTARMAEAGLPPHRLSRAAASNMYWTVAQIITHHASNGCSLNPGDLFGSGTISAPSEQGFGSLIELSRGGTQPIELPGGERRTFLEDGDEVIFKAVANAPGYVPLGFGECRGKILPALS